MPTPGYSAGFERMLIWLTSGKYAAGTAGDGLADGGTTHAVLVEDVESANLNFQPSTPVDIRGGDRIAATMMFGNPRLNSFDIQISIINPTLIAMLSDTVVDETENSEFELYSNNTFKLDPIYVGIMLTQRHQPKSLGASGDDEYHTLCIPRAAVVVQPGNFGYQAPSMITLSVTPTFTDSLPNGTLFSDTSLGVEGDRADNFELITEKPMHITTFKGNASDDTFNLLYTPASEVVTLAASKNWWAVDGTPAAPTSVTAATKAVALSAAPSASAMGVMIYQVESF